MTDGRGKNGPMSIAAETRAMATTYRDWTGRLCRVWSRTRRDVDMVTSSRARGAGMRDGGGAHTSRTMLLGDLSAVLASCAADSTRDE